MADTFTANFQGTVVLAEHGLSYRDVEELLAERGIAIDLVTIFRWALRFTPLLIMLPGRVGTPAGIGGSWMRLLSRSLGGGSPCTGRSISSARDQRSCETGATQRLGVVVGWSPDEAIHQLEFWSAQLR